MLWSIASTGDCDLSSRRIKVWKRYFALIWNLLLQVENRQLQQSYATSHHVLTFQNATLMRKRKLGWCCIEDNATNVGMSSSALELRHQFMPTIRAISCNTSHVVPFKKNITIICAFCLKECGIMSLLFEFWVLNFNGPEICTRRIQILRFGWYFSAFEE